MGKRADGILVAAAEHCVAQHLAELDGAGVGQGPPQSWQAVDVRVEGGGADPEAFGDGGQADGGDPVGIRDRQSGGDHVPAGDPHLPCHVASIVGICL